MPLTPPFSNNYHSISSRRQCIGDSLSLTQTLLISRTHLVRALVLQYTRAGKRSPRCSGITPTPCLLTQSRFFAAPAPHPARPHTPAHPSLTLPFNARPPLASPPNGTGGFPNKRVSNVSKFFSALTLEPLDGKGGSPQKSVKTCQSLPKSSNSLIVGPLKETGESPGKSVKNVSKRVKKSQTSRSSRRPQQTWQLSAAPQNQLPSCPQAFQGRGKRKK